MDEDDPENRSPERPGGSTELALGKTALPGPRPAPTELARERARLAAAARSYAEASLTASTRRAYQADHEDFSLWCHERHLAALPAAPETVCLYLTDLAQRGRAVSTLQRRVAALKLAHRTAGHEPSPTEDVAVRQVMRGIRRTVGIAPRRQAAPMIIQQLRVLLSANPDETLQDVQDYALLLLGFAFAGRASDLVSLDVEDIEFTDRGLLVHLRRSRPIRRARARWSPCPRDSTRKPTPSWRFAAGCRLVN